MHGGSSLPHPEQTEALPFFSESRLIRIETDPVVLNRQLNEAVRFRQMHRDMVGLCVPLDIVQRILQDAVKSQIGFGGQAFFHRRAVHLERQATILAKHWLA